MINEYKIVNEKCILDTSLIQETFSKNTPFKHVLIKDFLNEDFLSNILKEFPKVDGAAELKNEFGRKSKKHAVHDIKKLGPGFVKWDDFLKSEVFLSYMSEITGIPELIYDPEYHGAGTHNNMNGQGMDSHVDFNYHRTTNLHRRVNLIIYLNEEWESEWGGSLELSKDPWDPRSDWSKKYLPLINNAVIFETNEYSWHGFDQINLPSDRENLSRKSLTVYYYTKDRPKEEIAKKHGTIYVQKQNPKHLVKGYTLSSKDVEDMYLLSSRKNAYLKGMYERESSLLTRIENYKFQMEKMNKNLSYTTFGYAEQVLVPTGLLPTLKVLDFFECEYKAKKDLLSISLSGFVPSFVNNGKNKLSIYINMELVFEGEVDKSFDVTFSVSILEEEVFELKICPLFFESPFSRGLGNDKRSVSFMYESLDFKC